MQLFCEQLDVTDLEEVVPRLRRLTVTAEAYPRLEQVLCCLVVMRTVRVVLQFSFMFDPFSQEHAMTDSGKT